MRIKFALQSIQRNKDGLEDAKRIFDQGIISDIDTLRASIVYQNTLSLLTQARTSSSIALTTLKTEIGFSENDDIILLDSLLYVPDTYIDSISFDNAYKIALNGRPEIVALELQNKLYEVNKQAAISEVLPTLSAFAEFQINPVFVTNSSLNLTTTFVTGVQLNVPIFDGFKGASSIELAKLESEKFSLQLELAKERLRTEVHNQISKIREITERVGAKKQTLESAKRLYAVTKSRWEKGLSSQLELSDAELYLTESQVSFAQVIYEY
ncbi:hypothetical protein CHS0354_023747 [Potamilus streckersoni]|uniref:TolC family protein n=1 Tax=Potamilus streckersoni TaxID=2493646 RepID=A0AAE0VLP6_9BIVA|nr:hypothetical protein CHS0354_023747 [Potamilus streckersoni]